MLRFISVPGDLQETKSTTFDVSSDAIYPNLELARADVHDGSILVYDENMIPDFVLDKIKLNISDAMNGLPYRSPISVTAAGGYVTRETPAGRELLLIRRRGVWDLPKGKAAADESIEETALREVSEEIGADGVWIVRALGTTTHGYVDDSRYAVKTTHWFLMETDAQSFVPQETEQIEEVRWVRWEEARDMLDFDTLRNHMASIRF